MISVTVRLLVSLSLPVLSLACTGLGETLVRGRAALFHASLLLLVERSFLGLELVLRRLAGLRVCDRPIDIALLRVDCLVLSVDLGAGECTRRGAGWLCRARNGSRGRCRARDADPRG